MPGFAGSSFFFQKETYYFPSIPFVVSQIRLTLLVHWQADISGAELASADGREQGGHDGASSSGVALFWRELQGFPRVSSVFDPPETWLDKEQEKN